MPAAMARAPAGPSASRITSEAGVFVFARPETPKRVDADEVYREVKNDDAGHADDERARQIFSRLANFAGDEARGLPAAVGKQHRHHRRADSGKETEVVEAEHGVTPVAPVAPEVQPRHVALRT